MGRRETPVGAVLDLSVTSDHGPLHVALQVVEIVQDPAAKGLHRVAVLAGGQRGPFSDEDIERITGKETLFIVCLPVSTCVRRGWARVLGHSPPRPLTRELAPREVWSLDMIGVGAERGWKAGDAYEALD